MPEEREYILGTERAEVDRLRFQHQAWVEQAYALWERAGLRTGDTVLDLGCGPGFTSFELAHVVGPTGKVIARDVSPRFLDFLQSECERQPQARVEPSLGPVEDLDLPPATLDAAYARWLFCWLPDPGAALTRVARSLKKGGAVVIQDYLDWGAMKLVPRSDAFTRAVGACMQSWEQGEGTIDIGDCIPSIAAECGLHVESFRPVARLGPVGSLEWRWVGEFYDGYLPKLVERGLLNTGELEAFKQDWAQRTAQGRSFVYTPVVVDVVLRNPA